MAAQWFQHASTDVSQALDAGRLSAPDVHQTLTHVELTEQGWAEIDQRLLELLARTLELHAAAANENAETRRGTLLMAFFERARKRSADGNSSD